MDSPIEQCVQGRHENALAPGGHALAITYRPISDLKLDPSNPRVHSRKQLKQIANSIEAFGFNIPVLIDAQDKVIAGHGRIMACQLLGRATVPTISLDHLTPAQAKAFLIADNRLTEISQWDDRLLAEQFKELSFLDLDFELDATGFELPEIDLRIQCLDEAKPAEDDPANELPVVGGPAVSKPGDLWLLGSHRVIRGSALEAATYESLLDRERADLIFTDPPYNVPIQGHVSGNGAIQHREFRMASGEMSKAQFTAFLRQACGLLVAHSAAGSVHYICMDWRHLGELLAASEGVYSDLLNLCVWVKHNGGMGSLYRSRHELVFVFKSGKTAVCNNVQLGRFGRNRTNVWEYRGVNDFGRVTEEGNLLALHPTPKPVALVADAIMDCSKRGELVLDPFLGGGTTLIAAERTSRRCCAIELDPIYVDTAVRRWQAHTGEQAISAANGRPFASHEAEVAHVQ